MTNEGIQRIIVETGGCGRYQVLLGLIVHSMKCIVCFSVLHMVFGGKIPDWWCDDDHIIANNVTLSFNSTKENFKSCIAQDGLSECRKFRFDDSISTVINEWGLVCGNDWVSSTIVSVQMAGLFAGNIICGQVADLIGRKQPLFFAVLALVLLNVITAFSTSWHMFAVLRFFIGFFCGVELTVQYNIQSEFTLARWRSWVVSVPSWAIQQALFALASWAVKDWRHLHLITAATGFPLLFTYWFVPESFRWLLSHNRKDDAKRVIKKIARFNRKPEYVVNERDMILDDIEGRDDMKYTFLDLVKNRIVFKHSLILLVIWIVLGFGNYGIQFGVPALSGDLYLNMFIIGVLSSPVQFINIYLMNRFGRKATAILFYILFAATALIVGVVQRVEGSPVLDKVSSYSAIISLIAVTAAWSPIQTLTLEIYPTVVRNIGYGLQNTMARVGAIIGPQLMFLNVKVPGIMYFTCAVAAVVCIVMIIFLPETRSSDLSDIITSSESNESGDGINDSFIKPSNETRLV